MASESQRLLLQQGRLYLHLTRDKRLLRFIAQDESGEVLLFKVVALAWNPTPTEVLAWRREFSLELRDRERLQEYEEKVRPDYMGWTEEELIHRFKGSRKGISIDQNRAWFARSVEDFKAIERLVKPEALFTTYSPDTQAAVIREHIRNTTGEERRDPLAEQKLRRLLHRYSWFGMGSNSLLQLTHQRGHTDVLVRTYSVKTGAPNALVQLGGSERYAGRNITIRDVAIFVEALNRWYVELNCSYPATYKRMVEHFYVQATKNEAGEKVVWPISPLKIPTFYAFEKRAPQLVRDLKLNVDKAGRLDGKELQARLGYDADIAPRFGDIFDLDATSFNKEAILEVKLDGKTMNVGKNTVVIVRDRATGDPRGWHVYTGAESWAEGYRLALMCAITPKKRHLQYLGIDYPDAWEEGEDIAPLAVVIDNGPAVSKDAEAAFDRLGIRTRPAAPGNPPQKGGMEGMLGHAQNSQSQDPGGHKRNNSARDREVRRKSKQYASEETYLLERKLVLSLIDDRRQRNKQHLWTIEMKKAGVVPSSKEIVKFYIRAMGGVQMRLFSEADVYLSLLKRVSCELTKDGVQFASSRYSSPTLEKHRHNTLGKLTIQVLYHPTRPEEAFWITPSGELDCLFREKRGAKLFGHLTAAEIKLVNLRDRASEILEQERRAKAKSKKTGALTVEQHKILLDMASSSPNRVRMAPTKGIDDARKLALALQRDARPYDKPEVHVPDLAAKRAKALGVLPPAPAVPGGALQPDLKAAPSPAAMAPPESPPVVSVPTPSTGGRVRSADLWLQQLHAPKDGGKGGGAI